MDERVGRIMARIMLIDDEADVRLALSVFLEHAGFEVDAFENADLAIEALKQDTYDVAVIDIIMPERNGIEVISEIRSQKLAVKIIAMSGGDPKLPAATALQLSEMFAADATLYKPFNSEELAKTISELL